MRRLIVRGPGLRGPAGQDGRDGLPGGPSRGVVDVRDTGAKLDGSTDDSAAIQAAIDAVSAAGGGVVYIPGQAAMSSSKRCVINTTLRLKTGVWLRGAGAATVLAGTANPMIALPTSGDVVDRVTISDLFLQTPAGEGIKLDTAGTTGGHQLGWPRITVDNVTVTDAGSHAFHIENSAVIEARLINCVSLRAGGHGFLIGSTDNFLIGCTGAAGSQDGFQIQGANNKITSCKGYGNAGTGIALQGGGRHVVSGCEAQDNGAGYALSGSFNTVSGCLSDSDGAAGFTVSGDDNMLTGCTAMAGGGGSGQVAPVGFSLIGARNVVIGAVGNLATLIGGDLSANTATSTGHSLRTIATSGAITLPSNVGGAVEISLTGNTTISKPAKARRGERLTLVLKQDASGGRTVTFGPGLLASWTPDTAPSRINTITFLSDGADWIEVSAVVGIARPSAGASDTFNRSDTTGSLGTTTSGTPWNNQQGLWGVQSNQAAPQQLVSGGALALVDSGLADCVVSVTVVGSSGVSAGLVFRYRDSNNHLAWIGNQFVGVISGVVVNFQSGLPSIVTGDVLAATLAGSNITLRKNGTVIFAGTVNDLVENTKHGMFSDSTSDRFDNFSALPA